MHYLTATCWNKNAIQARECKDHPRVRSTTYMEVHNLIGTSGCSNEDPYWSWSVLGVIETPYGSLVVNPGDWIIEHHSMLLGIVKIGRLRYLEQFLPIERIRYDEINLLDVAGNMKVDKCEETGQTIIDFIEKWYLDVTKGPIENSHLKTDDRLINKHSDKDN